MVLSSKFRGRTFIIAEAGVNHNGSVDIAMRMIDAAKDAGADAVKFQTFRTEATISVGAEKAEYQKANGPAGESQYEMVKALELSFEDFTDLKMYADDKGIIFLSTGFDRESVEFLGRTLDVPIMKVPSGEITNLPLLVAVAGQGKPVILSTGMSDMDEIGRAIDVLKEHGAGEITLLQCTTEYPAPFDDVNLRAMQTMRDAFDVPVGYSDHTVGIEAAVAAVVLGAVVVEKHFTLGRDMPGPDHRASLEPDELEAMVRAIRNVERAMGSGEKTIVASEMKNRDIARKSIVAARPISKGETFTEDNLAVKRPGTGLSPTKWDEVVGKSSERDYDTDEQVLL
jgi:N,N'-diacetyllegionaminate synthase